MAPRSSYWARRISWRRRQGGAGVGPGSAAPSTPGATSGWAYWTRTGRAGVSNGPTEATNALIKKVKRVGHGFRNLANTACGCC